MDIQEDSIFLRHRHGAPLLIGSDIKDKVSEILLLLRQNDDHKAVFRDVIKDIRDGSGMGVHPDSTWYQATRELFMRYERYYDSPLAMPSKEALMGLMELLVRDGDVRLSWDEIRSYLIDNLEALSPLSNRSLIWGDREVYRGGDGKYYYEDSEYGTVEVTGVKTPAEETLQFYTNDIQMRYGRLYYILRYIALFDIAYEYRHNNADFPKQLSCTMYDNDGSTNYLDWQWQMPIPFDFVPFQWHPRSPFSNPDWLGSDLVMHLPYPNAQPRESVLPNPPTNEMINNYNEGFSGYKYQLEIPLQSNILISTEPEVYFDFLDRKVRLVNGNAFIQPILMVPCNDDDGSDGLMVARKFMSAINIEHEIVLSEQLRSLQQRRIQPWFRQPRMGIFQIIDPEYALPHDIASYSDKKWQALAFMREGVSSNSIYYSFLNYYKVVELCNKGNSDKAQAWINKNIERVCTEKGIDWYQKKVVEGGEEDPGFYLHKTERVAIAHAEYNFKGKFTHSPDDPTDWQRTEVDIVVMKALAKDIVESLK
jgi:hypothetical protein